MKKETVDNDEILNIVNEIGEENRKVEEMKKDYPIEIEKLEQSLLNYIRENDLNLLRTELPDKWKNLTKKLAYPYEYLNSIKIIKNLLKYKRKNISSVNL